mgnify:CR=1 FL=1
MTKDLEIEPQRHFVTGGAGTIKADNLFYDRSREARCVNVVAFQDFSSMAQKLSEQVALNLLSCLQNKVFLRLETHSSCEIAAALCKNAGLTALTPEDFAGLADYTAVLKYADGDRGAEAVRVDLMKHYEMDALLGQIVS